MGIENVEDFTQWYALGNKLKGIVCLNKEKSLQEELDRVPHIARLRRNIASAVAIYEKENKEYLANKKTEKKNKNAGTVKEATTQGATPDTQGEGATQTTQGAVLSAELIAQLLAKALESGGATQTTATTAKKRVK